MVSLHSDETEWLRHLILTKKFGKYLKTLKTFQVLYIKNSTNFLNSIATFQGDYYS